MPALQHQLLRHFGKQRHGSAFLLQAAHGQRQPLRFSRFDLRGQHAHVRADLKIARLQMLRRRQREPGRLRRPTVAAGRPPIQPDKQHQFMMLRLHFEMLAAAFTLQHRQPHAVIRRFFSNADFRAAHTQAAAPGQ